MAELIATAKIMACVAIPFTLWLVAGIFAGTMLSSRYDREHGLEEEYHG